MYKSFDYIADAIIATIDAAAIMTIAMTRMKRAIGIKRDAPVALIVLISWYLEIPIIWEINECKAPTILIPITIPKTTSHAIGMLLKLPNVSGFNGSTSCKKSNVFF